MDLLVWQRNALYGILAVVHFVFSLKDYSKASSPKSANGLKVRKIPRSELGAGSRGAEVNRRSARRRCCAGDVGDLRRFLRHWAYISLHRKPILSSY